MLQLLCALFLSLAFIGPPYKAIVVDAETKRPVEAAAIERLDERGVIGVLTADAKGEFTLPASTVHLRISRIGYSPLEVTRSARPDSQPDTIRLYAQHMALQEVLVRPGKPVTLASLPGKVKTIGSGLLPGQAVAMLMRPATITAPAGLQLTALRLYLNDRPQEGRLRIRLLNVVGGASEQDPPKPGIVDLLPTPLLCGPEELGRLPKNTLLLNLTPYALTVPPEGVYVMVECLLTEPNLTPESVKLQPGSKHELAITARTATNEPVLLLRPYNVFPRLQASYAAPTTHIWYRLGTSAAWAQRATRSYCVRMELDALLH